MTLTGLIDDSSATSAKGSILIPQLRQIFAISALTYGVGTSAASAASGKAACAPVDGAYSFDRTSSGVASEQPARPTSQLSELRRISGLTWEQLAQVFDVDRRSVHFWMSGKNMSPGNREHLSRVLTVARRVDTGLSSANRTLLTTALEDGELPITLLAKGEYDRVAALARGVPVRRLRSTRPTAEMIEERRPPPPADLLGLIEAPVLPHSGRLISAKPLRLPPKK